jgi:hypothetical protein
MSVLKRVSLTLNSVTRHFAILPVALADDAELLSLVRLEFGLHASAAVALWVACADGSLMLCPLKSAVLDNGASYTLKVYPVVPAKAPTAAIAAQPHVPVAAKVTWNAKMER